MIGGRTAKAAWLLLALAMTAGGPSQAQVAAVHSSRDVSATDRARDTLNRYAECVVKARPRMTKEALALKSDIEATKAFNALMKPECLDGGFLRMDAVAIRGPFYRALYLQEFGKNEPDLRPLPTEQAASDEKGYQAFGACVMRDAPVAARAFVLALPGSDEEKQALTDLRPTFDACVNPTEQLTFTKAALDSTLAEALYKHALAASRNSEVARAKP